jgi:hypothetical protein
LIIPKVKYPAGIFQKDTSGILPIYKALDEVSIRNNPHLRRERRHLFI